MNLLLSFCLIFFLIIIIFIILANTAPSLLINDLDSMYFKKLKGKEKYKLSIVARIISIITGFAFLFIFNWKLGLSYLFFILFFILNKKWENYGK